jgi:hypothetical protein
LIICEHDQAARAYIAGNAMDGKVAKDQWGLVTCEPPPGYRLSAPVAISPAAVETPATAFERVLAQAGASKHRDGVDRRVVAEVRKRSGRIIDSQASVGGWPALRSLPAPADNDGDGMPDRWEGAHKLDAANPSDGTSDPDGDGYTNLEDYLNALAKVRR